MAKETTSSWEPCISAFLFKVQNSPEFFSYYNMSDDEAMELAIKRAKGYLIEALSRFTLECSPDVDFLDYDPLLETFGFEMTNEEVSLLACLMFEEFIAKDVAKLRVVNKLLTSQDLKAIYGVPYAERKSFMEMYNTLYRNNNTLIDRYISKDRLTGRRKTIDYNM